MLSTPAPLVTLISIFAEIYRPGCSLTRPREDKIASLQKQIDFHTAEAHRLRSVQNSHVAISQLPAELLSNVFLYIVETGLRKGHKRFAVGTFTFLRVCRRWNEVAVESPQLWVWWIPGTLKAWNQFKSRSKDAPLFLTWRTCLPKSALNILTGTETPRRIRQLDIDGTRKQLGRILGALDSKSTSTTSSIRLQCDHNKKNNGEHLTRFFSLPFPKLSKLDIDTFPPDPTSSILTTSNLTSLKLNLTYNDNCRYTQSQFLQVFQQHPNLKQLDLKIGGLSLAKNSRAPAPIVLPRLVDLKLCGTDEGIDGFIDLISMSSPLHSVIIDFQHDHTPSVENTTKKFLMVYYGCQGPEHPRKAAWLTVSSSYQFQDGLIIRAESRSTPASRSLYNLQLKFHGMEGALAQRVIPLFPLEHVHGYVIERSNILTNDWCMMLRRMNDLWLLRLDSVDIEPVLNALDLSDEGVRKLNHNI